MNQPPELTNDRIEQMAAYAVSYAQEKRKPSLWESLLAHKARFTLSAAGSALVAASIVFLVSGTPPQTKVQPPHTATSGEVSDIMFYDLLEDLS